MECDELMRWMNQMIEWDNWMRWVNEKNEWEEWMRWMRWDEGMRWITVMKTQIYYCDKSSSRWWKFITVMKINCVSRNPSQWCW